LSEQIPRFGYHFSMHAGAGSSSTSSTRTNGCPNKTMVRRNVFPTSSNPIRPSPFPKTYLPYAYPQSAGPLRPDRHSKRAPWP
jgi:hypothetical protein